MRRRSRCSSKSSLAAVGLAAALMLPAFFGHLGYRVDANVTCLPLDVCNIFCLCIKIPGAAWPAPASLSPNSGSAPLPAQPYSPPRRLPCSPRISRLHFHHRPARRSSRKRLFQPTAHTPPPHPPGGELLPPGTPAAAQLGG